MLHQVARLQDQETRTSTRRLQIDVNRESQVFGEAKRIRQGLGALAKSQQMPSELGCGDLFGKGDVPDQGLHVAHVTDLALGEQRFSPASGDYLQVE